MTALPANAQATEETLANLWGLAALPTNALARARLTGDTPLLASSFHVGVAAQSCVAAAALAATEFARIRGDEPSDVHVNMHDAERECTG